MRAFQPDDLPAATALTIGVFRPFYEDYVRDLLGPVVFTHQHGQWDQDYRDELPQLHDPAAGSHVAVAAAEGELVGLVSWRPGSRPASGEIYLLAVAPDGRRRGVGRALCEHAIAAMKETGIGFVGLGTGEDAFHAPARALYESLGFTKIPTVAYLKQV